LKQLDKLLKKLLQDQSNKILPETQANTTFPMLKFGTASERLLSDDGRWKSLVN